MNETLMGDLRASVLLEALREIEEIADDEVDINSNGGPNAAMRIVLIAHAAIAKADPPRPWADEWADEPAFKEVVEGIRRARARQAEGKS